MAVAKPSSGRIAYIGLGSNLGDRAKYLSDAIADLAALGTVGAVSSFYETSPVGNLAQPEFLNAVAELRTELSPEDLMAELLRIERCHGRDRENATPKGPRTLDLDLLACDDLVIDTALLTLPHPALAERAFVLVPLAEVAPQWRHPVRGKSAAQFLAELPQSRDSGRPEVRKMFQPQRLLQGT
jgi:2-amino-4-hydroxy-6-hydroxymethyldihydropteridine diphosphokinase